MRKRVTIEWNSNFPEITDGQSHFTEEDVEINSNGWVTVQQQDNVVVHYSPASVKRVIVTEGTGL